jgi:hypothetical protein
MRNPQTRSGVYPVRVSASERSSEVILGKYGEILAHRTSQPFGVCTRGRRFRAAHEQNAHGLAGNALRPGAARPADASGRPLARLCKFAMAAEFISGFTRAPFFRSWYRFPT